MYSSNISAEIITFAAALISAVICGGIGFLSGRRKGRAVRAAKQR